ncbi:ATP-binding protein [Ornithinibacillus contaminans]|uniref:ATP-binding protein n=1 Tax=Ornithinibacillus contaminans TaxID=694055 RepID=UPI00064D9941|nr:AAA family ATPase [Ornithinibacillus contaminans]
MRLVDATIYGFGKWVDYSIDFGEDTFLTIYGENESGKSTIQRFILFMLFGLPPKQRKFYQPKTSSKMGGRLTVIDQEIGKYTIERLNDVRNGAAKCYTPDGSEYDEEWLQERLHGMNATTFQAIFSFSALDLSEIQLMKEEDMGEVLLGIGLTGSTHIHAIEKRLEQRLSDYFKPYGKKPEINQQLQKLDTLFNELTVMKNEEASYRNKKNAILELETDMESIKETLLQEKLDQLQLEKMIQAIPQMEEYIGYQQRLADFPEEIPFPEEGIERLAVLKDKLLPLKSEQKILVKNKETLLCEKAELEEANNAFPLEKVQQIQSFHTTYKGNKQELQRFQEQISKLDNELSIQLLELNIGLTLAELETLDLPFHLEKQWTDLKNEVEQIEREKQSNAESIQLAKTKQQYLQEQINELKSKLLPLEHRTELEAVIAKQQETVLLEKMQHDAAKRQKAWQHTKQKTNTRTRLVLTACLVAAIVFTVLLFIAENTMFVIGVVVSLCMGIIQWIWGKKSINDIESVLLSLPDDGNTSRISTEELLRAEQQIRTDQEYKNEIALLVEQLKDTAIQSTQFDEQKIVVEQREAKLFAKLDEQIHRYPFLAALDVAYWPELYHALKRFVRSAQQKKELTAEQDKLNKKLADFHDVLVTFFERHYETDRIPKTLIGKLELLDAEMEAYQVRKTQLSNTTKGLTAIQEKLQELLLSIETIESEQKHLFNIAKVEDEEAFYKQAKELKEQEELTVYSEKLAEQLTLLFSGEEWKELIQTKPSRSTVELQQETVKNRIDKLEADLEEKRKQLATITVEFNRLESSEAYSQTLHKFHAEKERLQKLAREWAVYKTAKELLSESKDNYRDKYLTKVMDKTSEFFFEITEGKYLQVYPPSEDRLFTVEHVSHIHYTVNELSQGTMNQLYVALRFAISDVMSENMPFPFLVDDAFVHFDGPRMKQVKRLLDRITKKHQLILFTCKNEVAGEFDSYNLLKLTNAVPLMEK